MHPIHRITPKGSRQQAVKARGIALAQEQAKIMLSPQKEIVKKTVTEVYLEKM